VGSVLEGITKKKRRVEVNHTFTQVQEGREGRTRRTSGKKKKRGEEKESGFTSFRGFGFTAKRRKKGRGIGAPGASPSEKVGRGRTPALFRPGKGGGNRAVSDKKGQKEGTKQTNVNIGKSITLKPGLGGEFPFLERGKPGSPANSQVLKVKRGHFYFPGGEGIKKIGMTLLQGEPGGETRTPVRRGGGRNLQEKNHRCRAHKLAAKEKRIGSISVRARGVKKKSGVTTSKRRFKGGRLCEKKSRGRKRVYSPS